MLETAQDDAQAGAEASRQVEAMIGFVQDPRLRQYLQSLGEKLVRFAPAQPFEYRFQVVDQWSPNAFALPGGQIFVSRGLLALTNSEDELACVLGHEITHAAERHAASQQAFSQQLSPFSLALPRQAIVAKYARDQERAADTGGQRICSAAGYDPRALSSFLESLGGIDRLQMGVSRIPTFLDSHPGTPERIATTAAFASTLPPPGPRDPVRAREAYLARLEGLLLGADPSEGVILGSRFVHPDLGFSVTFPEGWRVVNTASAVVARSPRRDARFALEPAGPGSDPRAVAEPYLAQRVQEWRAVLDFQGAEATPCCAAYVVRGSVESTQGVIAGQLAWVVLAGRVYRLSAAFVPTASEKYAERARQMVQSFRPLTDEERAGIRVNRLHLARARAGESLASFSARTGNVYDAQPTALANGLAPGTRLSAGQLLKIGVQKTYEPQK
ncbi:MAG TPA: M48 family metalloprotease [Myxococcota bacterium]|nr:M48 family metalloprotease [Myxococcota bacterium]